MKVWIVLQDSHEDKWPVGVFSSAEKAQEYLRSFNMDRRYGKVWIADEEGFEMDTPRFPSLL